MPNDIPKPPYLVELQNIADATTAFKTIEQNIRTIINDLVPTAAMTLELYNYTDAPLIKIEEHLSWGGWVAAGLPSDQIPPRNALILGGYGKPTGTQGYITYAGDGFKVTASWDDPLIGDNSCNFTISGANAFKYHLNHEVSRGTMSEKLLELSSGVVVI